MRIIIGIDLAGTTNPEETVAAVFAEEGNGLTCLSVENDLSDEAIMQRIVQYGHAGEIALGIDAPLSYEFGGGDRPADRRLRQAIAAIGMKTSSVMAPTAPRMGYLTMRGIALSRALEQVKVNSELRIAEVHPGAAIGFRMPARPVPAMVLQYKQPERAADRAYLAEWLEREMGLCGVVSRLGERLSSHEVDACAAALAAWKWVNGQHMWIWPSSGPLHPYDLVC